MLALDHASDKESITDYEIWRLWTYQFAHVGISHLSLNVLLQVCFGTVLETIHGVGLDNLTLPFLVFISFNVKKKIKFVHPGVTQLKDLCEFVYSTQ